MLNLHPIGISVKNLFASENYNYKLSTQYSASHNDILLTPSLSEGFFYLFFI
ncbi:hypothetical protein THOG05_480003 [Vibrio rotiferianus]|nr:hypothetical protein THOG05_480003 [Vibrio rotiferianus]CAH1569639.1 hypothetical protein THOE12_290003 [Vibrio rotiferianus]